MVYAEKSSGALYLSYYSGAQWYGNIPVTINSEQQAAAHSPSLVAYTDPNSTQEMLLLAFVTSDNEIQCLNFDGNSWSTEKMSGSYSADSSVELVVFDGVANMFYSIDGTLSFIYRENGTWGQQAKTVLKDSSSYGSVGLVGTPSLVSASVPGGAETGWYLMAAYTSSDGGLMNLGALSWNSDPGTWESQGMNPVSKETDSCNPRLVVSDSLGVAAEEADEKWSQTQTANTSSWMGGLPDSMLINQVNIPGSHDAAAIRFEPSSVPSFDPVFIIFDKVKSEVESNWECQDRSLDTQLNRGIRLLDIRISVSMENSQFEFTTCHGNKGKEVDLNLFQSLPSALNTCRDFLRTNPTETLLLSLKVDDWRVESSEKEAAYQALNQLINSYPSLFYTGTIPTLGSLRGKMLIFNRISSTFGGFYLSWSDNTQGQLIDTQQGSSYFYVQDYYDIGNIINRQNKLIQIEEAIMKLNNIYIWAKPLSENPEDNLYELPSKKNLIVWNFASAIHYKYVGVATSPAPSILSTKESVFNSFGNTYNDRMTLDEPIGWMLMDFSTDFYRVKPDGKSSYESSLIDFIVQSNFSYKGFSFYFSVEKI